MFRRKGPTANEMGIPAYTNWAEFEPDDSPADDGDNSELQRQFEGFVDPALIEKHLKEAG